MYANPFAGLDHEDSYTMGSRKWGESGICITVSRLSDWQGKWVVSGLTHIAYDKLELVGSLLGCEGL